MTNQPKISSLTPQKFELPAGSLPTSNRNSRGNSTTIYAELFKEYAEEIKMRIGGSISLQLNPSVLSKSIVDSSY